MTSHTKPWKETQLKELKKLVPKYKVIGIANLNEFPAGLFQAIRKKLKGKALVKVSKTRLIQKALEGTAFDSLKEKANGKSVAVIFSEINPFELFNYLKKNKGRVYAKEGQIAEDDIMIPAGDSGLPPGPALSELKNAGLQVKVAGPTIEIVKDKVVTKKGEKVTSAVAGVLSKLDIKPMKIGLSLFAVQEGNETFLPEVLDIDEEQVFANFVLGHQKAFNLAVNSAYYCEATIELLVSKSFNDAKAVSIEANIVNSATIGSLLGKAKRTAQSIKIQVKDSVSAEEKNKTEILAEESQEKAEEIKEEKKE
ncbi:MAG: 50S ribosomal protein L10 [Candidatus Diapherotrites archaeon]